jgi:hypothetical protein
MLKLWRVTVWRPAHPVVAWRRVHPEGGKPALARRDAQPEVATLAPFQGRSSGMSEASWRGMWERGGLGARYSQHPPAVGR